jgi:hypothetical protein
MEINEKTQLETLEPYLDNREWRLNNLYHIKNAKGQDIIFKFNDTQKYLYDNLWYCNTILKARQHGITSFFCILFLDDTIFNFKNSAILSYTTQSAQDIFDSKIKYAWERLPECLKQSYQVDFNNVRMLKVKRKDKEATIYIGTSLRGGTVQRLHISELSTLDQKYPDKSEEIKTGALNTVHAGQVVTIESTAKGRFGNFYEICKQAQEIKKSDKELGPLDYRFFFFPWYKSKEYQLENPTVIPRERQEYFDRVEKETGDVLTIPQRTWYYKKSLVMKDAMKSEFPSTPEEAFLANVEGSYYGKVMDRLREKKRIINIPYDPKLLVDTWWDLGIGDSTSIIFTQQTGLEIRVIDYYENSGEGLAHYAKVLQDKGYVYNSHNAPHDIEVRELGTGKSRKETAGELNIMFNVVPNLSIEDGIEAVRNVLHKCWFDEKNTDPLIRALTEYRKEWDDKLGCFKNRPLHNWASHPADAFRMMAVGSKEIRELEILDEEEIEMMKLKESKAHDPFNPLDSPF